MRHGCSNGLAGSRCQFPGKPMRFFILDIETHECFYLLYILFYHSTIEVRRLLLRKANINPIVVNEPLGLKCPDDVVELLHGPFAAADRMKVE